MQQPVTRWLSLRRNLGEHYSPLFFLAALGNGGMAITFFIWLNFLIPHPNTPIVTFDSIAQWLSTASAPAYFLTLGAMAGIIIFALRHIRLLIWNLQEYARYRQTSAYPALRNTNAAVTLMALPLTLAMTVNVLFASGAVFVPRLWTVVEYLFPISLTVLTIIGIVALRLFLDLFGRALAGGHFDCTRNNNLTQLQAAMTFAMVAVGLAAPAAMSHNKVTIAVSILLSVFFLSAAVLLGVVLLVLGFRAMLAHGLAVEAGPSLWLPIPILTLIGIALIRIRHGLHHGFEVHIEPGNTFILIGTILALQLLVGVIGYAVLRQVDYLRTYLWGQGRSPGSYGLICPGVALFVFGMFFVHLGLVQTGLITKYSPVHYLIMVPLAAVQVLTIIAMLRLDAKLLRPQQAAVQKTEMATAQD